MSIAIENKFIEYLDKFEGSIEKAVDFAGEQVPLVVSEYLQFEMFLAIKSLIICVICLIIAIWYFTTKYKVTIEWIDHHLENKRGSPKISAGKGSLYCVLAIASSCFLAITPFQINDDVTKIYKINSAPRIFLLEKVSELSK